MGVRADGAAAGTVTGHVPAGPGYSQTPGAHSDCILSPAPADAKGSGIAAVPVSTQVVLLRSSLVRPSQHPGPSESHRLGDVEDGCDTQSHQLMALQLPWPQSCFRRLMPAPAAPQLITTKLNTGLPAPECGVSQGQQSPKVPVRQKGGSRNFPSCLE